MDEIEKASESRPLLARIDTEPTDENIKQSLSEDVIGRHPDLVLFLNLLQQTAPPYVYCLDARWGEGKTFFVKQLVSLMNEANPNIASEGNEEAASFLEKYPIYGEKQFVPLYFNAWENDHYEDPLAPLLCEMAERFGEEGLKRNLDIKATVTSILNIIVKQGTKAITHGALEIEPREIIEITEGESILKEYQERQSLRSRFDELVEELLRETGDTFVLFVDELDRCNPTFALKTIEQLKNLFHNDKVIIVYSADMQQLQYALQGVYGTNFDTKKYLERFFDQRFALTYVDGVKYLEQKGYPPRNMAWPYLILNEYMDYSGMPMRDCNRFFTIVGEFIEYFATHHNQSHWDAAEDRNNKFLGQVLLPTTLFIEYEEPALWDRLKRCESLNEVYEFMSRSEKAIKAIDMCSEGYREDNQEPNEETRKAYVEDMCYIVFTPETNEQKYAELRSKYFVLGDPRNHVYREHILPTKE